MWDQNVDDLKEIQFKISQKCNKVVSDKLEMMVKNCALYTDFKDLYNKTCPPVASMQDTMQQFEREHY